MADAELGRLWRFAAAADGAAVVGERSNTSESERVPDRRRTSAVGTAVEHADVDSQ